MKTKKEIKEYLEANQEQWELGGMDLEENIRIKNVIEVNRKICRFSKLGAEIELLEWVLEESK